jgi:hypothetical protein
VTQAAHIGAEDAHHVVVGGFSIPRVAQIRSPTVYGIQPILMFTTYVGDGRYRPALPASDLNDGTASDSANQRPIYIGFFLAEPAFYVKWSVVST